MRQYIDSLQQIIPGISLKDLSISLKEPDTHILDAIIIKGALEQHFGLNISDNDWENFTRLSDALKYCFKERCSNGILNSPIIAERHWEICLPQMANSALSENWLLKEMGDMHWELLSKGIEQKTSEFADSTGNRLYAAFVRINYEISPLNLFHENEHMSLNGIIDRYRNHIYISKLHGICNKKNIDANLITSFSQRIDNDNTQFIPGKLVYSTNLIKEQVYPPTLYTEHRLLSKQRKNSIIHAGNEFLISDRIIHQYTHAINPYFEINGAGLLYFASYPMIADMCTSEFFSYHGGIEHYNKRYHTTSRDIFYFANCNTDDQIIVTLNDVAQIDSQTVKTTTSLHRVSDGKLMAKVLTVKQEMID